MLYTLKHPALYISFSQEKENSNPLFSFSPLCLKEQRQLMPIELVLGIDDLHWQATVPNLGLADMQNLLFLLGLHGAATQDEPNGRHTHIQTLIKADLLLPEDRISLLPSVLACDIPWGAYSFNLPFWVERTVLPISPPPDLTSMIGETSAKTCPMTFLQSDPSLPLPSPSTISCTVMFVDYK